MVISGNHLWPKLSCTPDGDTPLPRVSGINVIAPIAENDPSYVSGILVMCVTRLYHYHIISSLRAKLFLYY